MEALWKPAARIPAGAAPPGTLRGMPSIASDPAQRLYEVERDASAVIREADEQARHDGRSLAKLSAPMQELRERQQRLDAWEAHSAR